jgi:tol-pal system protein YbgF
MLFPFGHLLTSARAGLATALLLAVVLLPPTAPAASRDAYADGLAFYREQRWAEAAQAFQEFAAAFPDHPLAPDALFQAADCFFSLGQCLEAAQEFRAVADRFPQNELAPNALLKAALCQAKLGQDPTARETLAALASRSPNSRAAAKAKESFPPPLLPEPRAAQKPPGPGTASRGRPRSFAHPGRPPAVQRAFLTPSKKGIWRLSRPRWTPGRKPWPAGTRRGTRLYIKPRP